MNIKIAGRHMELTDALRSYVENALTKLESHFDKVLQADVVLEVQKLQQIAEVNLNINGVRIHSKESTGDMYASVDAAIDKLEKQIRKFKGRIKRHKPRVVDQLQDYHHAILALPMGNGADDHDKDESSHEVIKREQLPMTPLNIDEALMQLQLLGDHNFLVFSNADTAKVNVLYARGDGTYGLIEPQF